MKRVTVATLFFVGLLGPREAAAESGRSSPVLFPSAWSVAQYLWGALLDGTQTEAIWVTMKRFLRRGS